MYSQKMLKRAAKQNTDREVLKDDNTITTYLLSSSLPVWLLSGGGIVPVSLKATTSLKQIKDTVVLFVSDV